MPTLFNEDYTGPRFTYGFRYRPAGMIGHQPQGWIIGSQKEHKDYAHGTLDYPERLPAKEAASYELELVEERKQ